ncbi:hypothetical protein N0V87_005772 [Didymella glomerata]|uniref:Uncharacterized protein n=1 Tax=Didymella glomerata TaxID=749621 RepID=A0A9W8WXW8_9PLEO|nr:hypothetical protein N0V87_005772 [Didymella glomerata]
MSAPLPSDPRLPASSVPVAPMHSLSQADATIKELRKRMGDDLGLLSYLLDDETGQLKGHITLEEAMEKSSPMPAFTCVKSQHGRFDRAHLSSVLRYYFILQKVQLPTPWPISDIFVAELKAACKVAKANAEKSVLVHKSNKDVDAYTVSHKAIKGSRLSQATSISNSRASHHAKSGRPLEELEELEEEEDMLKNALKQSKAERKRLRTSVSARDMAFLQLGQTLAHRDSKRLRFDDSDEE